MKLALRFLLCMSLAPVFWVPTIMTHAVILPTQFGSPEVTFVTLSALGVVAADLLVIYRIIRGPWLRAAAASLMLLIIWGTGPWAVTLAASFGGGGFNQPGTILWLARHQLQFVASTFIGSTYDGTLGVLLLATACLLAVTLLNVLKALDETA